MYSNTLMTSVICHTLKIVEVQKSFGPGSLSKVPSATRKAHRFTVELSHHCCGLQEVHQTLDACPKSSPRSVVKFKKFLVDVDLLLMVERMFTKTTSYLSQ